jgi:hypothetical protein
MALIKVNSAITLYHGRLTGSSTRVGEQSTQTELGSYGRSNLPGLCKEFLPARELEVIDHIDQQQADVMHIG